MADDLDRRLRAALDRVPTTDVWGEATRPGRPDHRLPHRPSRGRRVVIAAFALLVFVVAVGSVAVRRNGREELSPPISRGPSTGLVMDGTLRCMVSVEDHVVPGAPLPITFSLTNVSSETQQVMEGTPSFTYTIESADGLTFDTAPDPGSLSGVKYNGPFPLAPGASWSPHDFLRLRVQSPGPLTITPRCMETTLAPIRVDVRAEGAAPSAEAAVASAVGSASGLFDGCLPAPNEAPVVGAIRPPKGSLVAPMPARCSARVQTYDGFDIVTFLIVAPPSAGDVQIPDGIPTEQNVQLPTGPTLDLIVWRFVVTADRTVSVYSFHRSKTQSSDATAPEWEVTAAGWNGPGGGICGSEGVGRGIDAPLVDFVNVCPGF
jgi:hypothetical protein